MVRPESNQWSDLNRINESNIKIWSDLNRIKLFPEWWKQCQCFAKEDDFKK